MDLNQEVRSRLNGLLGWLDRINLHYAKGIGTYVKIYKKNAMLMVSIHLSFVAATFLPRLRK